MLVREGRYFFQWTLYATQMTPIDPNLTPVFMQKVMIEVLSKASGQYLVTPANEEVDYEAIAAGDSPQNPLFKLKYH